MEDVDYLLGHCERRNFQFMVDSRARDKAAYPTPSEYVVTFTTPFTNVVAVDVLEASVPRTNYNVDDASCALRVAIDGEPQVRVFEQPSTLDSSAWVASLEAALTPLTAKIVDGYLTLTSLMPFKIDLSSPPQWFRNVLGLGADAAVGSAGYAFVGTRSSFGSVLRTPFGSVLRTTNGQLRSDGAYALVAPMPFAIESMDATGQVVQLTLTLAEVRDVVLPTGDYDVLTLTTALSTAMTPVVAAPTSVPTEVKSTLTFTGPRAFALDFGVLNSAAEVLGFDTPSTYSAPAADAADAAAIQAAQYYSGGDAAIFASVPSETGHALVAPGIFSLIGDRYVLLRCTEVETTRDALSESYARGIAKFTLGVVGYANATVDFVRGGVREFHPIGRLSRLSLRFERPDGSLYNFRGVNHTLTFVVRYLVPRRDGAFVRSMINPNYDGNFAAWPRTDEEREGDSDGETESYNQANGPPLLSAASRAEGLALPENQAARRADFLRHLLDE